MMRLFSHLMVASLAFWWTPTEAEVPVNWKDENSIKEAAATIAYGLVKYYTGNNTGDVPGNLPDPYYWWEAGAMFGALIDYFWLTGDDSYNNITRQAIVHQADGGALLPKNQTASLGNDDQGFYAMAIMSAAEHKLPDPPKDQVQYLGVLVSVFNQWVSRWETGDCGGGLRWQIFYFNNGFNYKNSISNGCFFNIAARMARYTNNDTYAEWAEKVWDWQESSGLLTGEYRVHDGVTIEQPGEACGRNGAEWTYNNGIFLHGAAVMYNITKDDKWRRRVDGLIDQGLKTFTEDQVIYESFCEREQACDNDQRSFKGYLARWYAATIQMADWTYDRLHPVLKKTAEQAVKACSGDEAAAKYKGHPGTACGFSWLNGSYDGFAGVSAQMNAMQVVSYMLLKGSTAPVTTDTGGTSEGNPGPEKNTGPRPMTVADRAGAGILTAMICAGFASGIWFMLREEQMKLPNVG